MSIRHTERYTKTPGSASVPDLRTVASYGDHSSWSWIDLDRIRDEMRAAGRKLPKLRSVT